VILTNSNFLNNNFDTQIHSFQGGFLVIESNTFSASNCKFQKSLGSSGSAISITPSNPSAAYFFVSCTFENLIASLYGAAVYISGVLKSAVLTFEFCEFKEIASKYGAVVQMSFQTTSLEAHNYLLFPTLTMSSCNSTHVYASSGGLVYAENAYVNLKDILSTENNPANVLTSNENLIAFLAELQTIGMYISVTGSFFSGESLKIQGHSVDLSK